MYLCMYVYFFYVFSILDKILYFISIIVGFGLLLFIFKSPEYSKIKSCTKNANLINWCVFQVSITSSFQLYNKDQIIPMRNMYNNFKCAGWTPGHQQKLT